MSEAPAKEAMSEEVLEYNKNNDGDNTATCIIIVDMSLKLQK